MRSTLRNGFRTSPAANTGCDLGLKAAALRLVVFPWNNPRPAAFVRNAACLYAGEQIVKPPCDGADRFAEADAFAPVFQLSDGGDDRRGAGAEGFAQRALAMGLKQLVDADCPLAGLQTETLGELQHAPAGDAFEDTAVGGGVTSAPSMTNITFMAPTSSI